MKDISGHSFGRLLAFVKSADAGDKWLCRCTCGNVVTVDGSILRAGRKESCGCLQLESVTRHGLSKSPEYNCWQQLIQRCTNPNNPGFKHYGERSIQVCQRWLDSFEAFYADMGPRPSTEHSIERKDVNGNYEPSNCVWASRLEQANNRTTSTYVQTADGQLTVAEGARSKGLHPSTVHARLRRGISGTEALAPSKTTYEFEGRQLTLRELSEKTGVSYQQLYRKIRQKGLPAQEVIAQERSKQ